MELLEATGVGRDVNRHHYSPQEVEQALARPVVRAQLDALRLRRDHPAFEGVFTSSVSGTRATLSWELARDGATHRVELELDVQDSSFSLRATHDGEERAVLDESAV
jgi:sucrose phosphorylase